MSLSRRKFTAGLLASAAIPCLCGACSVNPATGEHSFTAFMSPEDELKVGRGEHPKLVKAFGGEYHDRRLNGYLTDVGNSMARLSEMPDLPFKFTILNSDIVNAFALPGGFVHVSRGLMALAGDEAELAGVIGHEIGHVTARHSAQRYSQAMATNIGLTAVGLGLSILGAGAAGQSVMDVASYGASAYLQSYSRDHEFEADTLGVRYMSRAGYEPEAMVKFLEKLRRHDVLQARMAGRPEGSVDEFNMMSTHPRPIDRVQKAMVAAQVTPSQSRTLGRERFLESLNGMLFGDDPQQGLVKGRDFFHPVLRFRFQVPEGFRLNNGDVRVVARNPAGAAIVFDGARQQSSGNMVAYLTREWAAKLRLGNVEALTVDGMEAATGHTQLASRQGPARDARLVAIRFDGAQIYRFLFIAPANQAGQYAEAFRRVTYSFHRLSAAEADAIKPLRLIVVPARSGDTVEKLARTLPYEQYNRDWFMLLNDLEEANGLKPGQLVKVVAG